MGRFLKVGSNQFSGFKGKVYGWTMDGRRLIPIAHFEPLAPLRAWPIVTPGSSFEQT